MILPLFCLLLGALLAPSLVALAMGDRLPVGTRSFLYGAHCWWIHPWFVALGWWKLYGFRAVRCPCSGVRTGLFDPRLWLCFWVHNIGYLGKPNMDGEEGEMHPLLGARIVLWIIETSGWRWTAEAWRDFTLYHSRFLAKKHGRRFSLLCPADKMAIALTPAWLYLPMAVLTGEFWEYRKLALPYRRGGSRGWFLHGDETHREWFAKVQECCRRWALEHADGRDDAWTPRSDERVAQDAEGVWR